MPNNGDIIPFLKTKDYEMINNNLGGGAFGTTVLLRDPFIDELFVAKKYDPIDLIDKKEFYTTFLQEIKILYSINHPNIVRIFSYYPYESQLTGYIIMEYINGKTLDKYLSPYDDSNRDYPDTDGVFKQLINGFVYLEEHNIIHRDIRERNIMVNSDGIAKIIDFGLGKTFHPAETSDDSLKSIIDRLSPDLLPNEYQQRVYDSQTDMFYLGELYNRLIRDGGYSDVFSFGNICRKMMEPNKKDRYATFSEVQEAINKKDLFSADISDADKRIYQNFTEEFIRCIVEISNETKYNRDVSLFIQKIQKVINKNCLEYYVQHIADVIPSMMDKCVYDRDGQISVRVIKEFLNWFTELTESTQQLVLNNFIAKISANVRVKADDLPF
jgi:serine/threonine-protein kinase